MIHERLQDLGIKITELSDYLQISRPTMYKFINSYDAGKRKAINKNVLKLFDYISKNDLIDKKNVVTFILTSLGDQGSDGPYENQELVESFKDYVLKNPDSEKTKFIESCIRDSHFDVVIHYMNEIGPLLSKKRLSAEEKDLLKPYRDIVNIYSR